MAKDVTQPKLDSEKFQEQLMRIIDPLAEKKSFLLILRNQVPTALMGPRLLQKRGTVPHYEDRRIRDYWIGLQQRHKLTTGNYDGPDYVTVD